MNTKKQYFFRLLSISILSVTLFGCAQYGMISENDVYLQKPTALSADDDETDITSYNAYKARQRGVYQDQYLIDQMHDRRLIGSMLYGVRPMFGTPYPPGSFVLWGYRSPILFYQNSHYFNSYYTWNRPWNYGYGFGCGYNPYNPYASGMYGCGYSPFNSYGNGYGYGQPNTGQNFAGNNNPTTSSNHFTGRPRLSLSSNSSRSSTYPATLKSSALQPVSSSAVNNQTQGTSRRAVRSKQQVRSSHMPFKTNTHTGSSYTRTNYSQGQRRNSTRSSSYNRTNTYTPSQSARRSGVARTPRSTVNSANTRGGYTSGQVRRTSSGTSSRSGYTPRTRSSSSSVSRSTGGGSRSGGGSTSSGSSSGRR